MRRVHGFLSTAKRNPFTILVFVFGLIMVWVGLTAFRLSLKVSWNIDINPLLFAIINIPVSAIVSGLVSTYFNKKLEKEKRLLADTDFKKTMLTALLLENRENQNRMYALGGLSSSDRDYTTSAWAEYKGHLHRLPKNLVSTLIKHYEEIIEGNRRVGFLYDDDNRKDWMKKDNAQIQKSFEDTEKALSEELRKIS